MHAFVRVILHEKYTRPHPPCSPDLTPYFLVFSFERQLAMKSIKWIMRKLLNTACWWLQRKNSNIYHARTYVLFRGR
jgi:hypothetical protein